MYSVLHIWFIPSWKGTGETRSQRVASLKNEDVKRFVFAVTNVPVQIALNYHAIRSSSVGAECSHSFYALQVSANQKQWDDAVKCSELRSSEVVSHQHFSLLDELIANIRWYDLKGDTLFRVPSLHILGKLHTSSSFVLIEEQSLQRVLSFSESESVSACQMEEERFERFFCSFRFYSSWNKCCSKSVSMRHENRNVNRNFLMGYTVSFSDKTLMIVPV